VSDSFPRLSGWDSSVRSEPRGPFCRRHGFYDCPVCKGEEIAWEIPVMDGQTQIGLLRIPENFDDTLILISRGESGPSDTEPFEASGAAHATAGAGLGENVPAPSPRGLPQVDVVPVTNAPWLLARVKLIMEERGK
jgi:hypothetical protein